MAGQPNGVQSPLRVVVFDNMRSRSHIFSRLFSEHYELGLVWHPYVMTGFLGPDRPIARLRHSEARQREVMTDWAPMFVPETYGKATRDLDEKVAAVESSGKSLWVNEHCCFVLRQDVTFAHLQGHNYTPEDLGRNPTYLPDWLFETCTPILVIRHPALRVPSLYDMLTLTSRVVPDDEDFDFTSTLRYTRLLFDLLKSQGRTPVVVDGEDVVWRTKEMTTNVCKAIGIDPSGVVEQWEPTPRHERMPNPVAQQFLQTVYDSKGVLRPDEKPEEPLNIDVHMKKLEKKYGREIANQLRVYIEKNMEDYEYLSQFTV